jgi:hypothetical protein
MITPFLTLVLDGFGLFIGVLGTVWIRNSLEDRRVRRLASARPMSSEGQVGRAPEDRLAA